MTEKLKLLRLSSCKKYIALGSHGTSNKIEIIKLVRDEADQKLKLKKFFLININFHGDVCAMDWAADLETYPFLVVNSTKEEYVVVNITS